MKEGAPTRAAENDEPVEALVEEVLLRRLRGEDVRVDAVLGEHANASLRAEVRRRVEAAMRRESPAAHSRHAGEPDRILGDFTVVKEISRGRRGTVVLAHQISLGRTVFLRILPEGVGHDPARTRAFLRLARRLVELRHPAIVPVLTAGEEDGRLYLATEEFQGTSLARVFRELAEAVPSPEARSPADLTRALPRAAPVAVPIPERTYFEAMARIFAEIAEALAFAHGRGIFHRDVKPRTVILDPGGHPRLVDFGLAGILEATGMSRSADLVGGPAYCSPEVVACGSARVTAASDVFSLGATLHEALTGSPPYDERTIPDLLEAYRRGPRRPLRPRRGKVPRDLATICRKAMDAVPERRYATADAMARDLRAYLSAHPISAAPPGAIRKLSMVMRRHQGPSAVLGLVFLFVIVVVFGVITNAAIRHVRVRRAYRGALRATGHGNVSLARERLELLRDLGGFPEGERVESAISLVQAQGALERGQGLMRELVPSREELAGVRSRLRSLRERGREEYLDPSERGLLARLEARARALRLEIGRGFHEAESALREAASHALRAGLDPWPPVRAALASLYLERFREALRDGDGASEALYRDLVRRYDDTGSHAEAIRGGGTVRIDAPEGTPPGSLYRLVPVARVNPSASPGDRLVPVPYDSGGGAPEAVAPHPLFPRGIHPGDPCLVVVETPREGPAAVAGLRAGDLILEARAEGTASPEWKPLSLDEAGEVLDSWAASLRRPLAPGTLGLSALRGGVATEIEVTAGSPLGIETHPTAYPLLPAAGPSGRIDFPLEDLPLDPGPYLLVIRKRDSGGGMEQRIPFSVPRGGHVRLVVSPLPAGPPPPDAVWIPGGTDRGEGFWIGSLEITCAEWGRFLADPELRARLEGNQRPGRAPTLVPRRESGEPYRPDALAERGASPVTGISYRDALAYVAWRNRRLQARGAPYRAALPTAAEWQRAACGIAGRGTPWGGRFHQGLCRRKLSLLEGLPEPAPPHLGDESPYGVRNVAGGASEWTSDPVPGAPGMRYYCGGVMLPGKPTTFRAGSRTPLPETGVRSYLGLRLAYRPLPPERQNPR